MSRDDPRAALADGATLAACAPTPMAARSLPYSPAERAALDACARETRVAAKNFYFAFRFLPLPEREAMFALYAFCRLADDIVDEPGEVDAKRAGLDRLRQDLDQALAGHPEGGLMTALAGVRRRFPISPEHLHAVVDGCAMDLERARYETFDDLALYLDRVASAVGRATMEVCGVDPAAHPDYARAGGFAIQMTNILRDVSEDLERDRVYLPQEDLARFGVTDADLRRGVLTDGMRALMTFEVERTRGFYAEAHAALDERSRRAVLPLTAISRIYERVLDVIERRAGDVFSSRAKIPGWRKALLGLGTWTRAKLHLPIPR